MPQLPLLLSVLLAALAVQAAFAQGGDSVRVGFITWYQEKKDLDTASVLPVFMDGVQSAIQGVNSEGGINGKTLELVLCDVAYNQSSIQRCIAEFTAMDRLVAILPMLADSSVDWALPLARATQTMIAGPMVGNVRPFDTSFFLSRAETHLQYRALVKMAVNAAFYKRIGLIYSLNSGYEANVVEVVRTMLQELGLDLIGAFDIDFFGSSHSWQTNAYLPFLRTKPQVFLIVSPGTQSSFELLVDLLRRGVSNDEVDPDAKLLCLDQLTPTIPLALQVLKLNRTLRFDPTNKIFVASSNPLLTDVAGYAASRHAFADMVNFYNGSTRFTRKGIGYDVVTMIVWVAIRTLTAALRQLPSSNVTRAALQQRFFDTSIFAVDDLLVGPFSGTCHGARAEEKAHCECNNGYHIVEVYTYTNATAIASVRAARVSLPITRCASRGVPIEVPLVYAVFHVNDTLPAAIAAAMVAGQAAHEASMPLLVLKASLHQVRAANASALAATIAHEARERYLSVVMASVVDSAVLPSTLPVIDPIALPATLFANFQPNVLLISATLQQEMHTLCKLAGQRKWAVYVAAKGPQASGIVTAATLSANTFGFSLSGATTDGAWSAFQLPRASAVLVLGLIAAADIASIGAILASTNAEVFVAFSEFSALFETFTALPAEVHPRIHFASSQANWNSSVLSPPGYLATVPAARRSPLTLRGFIASSVVQKVVAYINGAVTPANFLSAVYLLSVIAADGGAVFGPFMNGTCKAGNERVCQSNVGANVVQTMSLADARHGAASNYSAVATFASGKIDYQPLPAATEEDPVKIYVGVICGVLGFLVLVVMARKMLQSKRFRMLLRSGLPLIVARIFTLGGTTVLFCFSVLTVFRSGANRMFIIVYLAVTVLAVLITILEVWVLIGYFLLHVESEKEPSDAVEASWHFRIGMIGLFSLGLKDGPQIIFAFYAVLQESLMVVVLSLCVATFLFGTKVADTVAFLKSLMKKEDTRSFHTLKDVVHFIITTARWTKKPLSAALQLELHKDSPLDEVEGYQSRIAQRNPKHTASLYKMIHSFQTRLRQDRVVADDFFGFVRPILTAEYDVDQKLGTRNSPRQRRSVTVAPSEVALVNPLVKATADPDLFCHNVDGNNDGNRSPTGDELVSDVLAEIPELFK